MPPPRLLVNPSAARGRARARIVAALDGVEVELREVETPEGMTREARRAVDDGLERLLVAGGDGALHHAIRGLAGTSCALGIVPLGTGNDLARALGIPADPRAAARAALHGTARAIDVGRVDRVPFAGVLGIGLDAEVNRRLAGFRSLPARWAYAAATLRALAGFTPPVVQIEGGASFSGKVLLAAFANSPVFGGGMRIAPDAAVDDGSLDVVVIDPVSWLTLLRVLPRVYDGRHLGHPAVRSMRLSRARVRATPDWTVYADGEPVATCGRDGIAIDVWHRALRIIA